MLDLLWPLALLLLPAPLLVRFLLPAQDAGQAALKVANTGDWLLQDSTGQTSASLARFGWLLPVLIWTALVVALARPVWVGDAVRLPASGRDLMLAVDISGSMDTGDMRINGEQVNRLTLVKHVLNDFITRREGDRLGLILFGSNAYLQTPLTFDRETVRTFLNESALGLAGKKTAIGDAIALAAKRMRNNPADSQVLILLTDGENTAGSIEPQRAAEVAAKMGIRIHTIGLGADTMEIPSFFGSRQINPSRELDETLLTTIASSTGGEFFRARNTEELDNIYRLIDQLEPTEKDEKTYRPESSLLHWPLLAALLLSWMQFLLLRRAG